MRISPLMTGAAAGVVAVGIFLAAASAHLERACVVRDTPYLPLCEQSTAAAAPPQAQAEARERLRQRIRENPGDAPAWTRLLMVAEPDTFDGILRAATVLAPNNGNVLRRRAAQAVERGNHPEAVRLLVQMLRNRGTADAAKVLAYLAASDEGTALLRPHVRDAQYWLPSVLSHLGAMKVPPGHALPLVAEAMAQGVLPDATRHTYMRALKAGGFWLDAYGLWLAHHKQTVPLLYNGGFDQALEPDGFDWEVTPVSRSKAGVVMEQQALARRGFVLDMEFTGRSFSRPLIRQYVFAPPGPYRLKGEYMASKLRSEGGLAWKVFCTSGGKEATVRTTNLQDTGGVWKVFEVDFTVPPDCGPVASLQLEPAAAFEAATGMKGRIAFDAFSLARSAN
jgi:hypothetical protein